MASPAENAANLLVTAGVGVLAPGVGWNIFWGKIPTSPDTIITLFNSPGAPPNPRFLLDFPSLNIRIRGAKLGLQVAYDKAKAVKDALLGLPPQAVGGDRWDSITMVGDINDLGFDESERPLMSLNFRLIIEPATGTNRISL